MGKIVGGFWMPHDPVMFVAPDAPPLAQREAVWGAYKACAERLAALQPTSVIIVGCDHYILFGTHCLPRYVIGTGDVDGPIDRLPGLERGAVRNHEALATHIVEHGDGQGVDWTVARSFTVDHSFSIPHQLVVKPAEALLVGIGATGEIVQVVMHTEENIPIYLVEFSERLVVGCFEEEILPL